MTGPEKFLAAAPDLVAAARVLDPGLRELVRESVRELFHYECPLGIVIDDAWVGVMVGKLETANNYRLNWTLQVAARAKWEKRLWPLICRALGVASQAGLRELGRLPECNRKMIAQLVRFVPTSREFIKDDDNRFYSGKVFYDALKHVGLVKDDNSTWLQMNQVVQDVSPNGHALTVFILQPAEPITNPSLFQEPTHVRQSRQPASQKSHHEDRNPQRRDDLDRQRRPRARTAHAKTREGTVQGNR